MACRDALKNKNRAVHPMDGAAEPVRIKSENLAIPERLFFGVDSKTPAYERLQNNLTLLEWVIKNKTYPNFWARTITGENALTKDEVKLLHSQGCKVATVYSSFDEKETEE